MADYLNADDRVDSWCHSLCSCGRPNPARPAGFDPKNFKIGCTTCLSDEVRHAESAAWCRGREHLMAHLGRPTFVRGRDESGRPRGFMNWNRATRQWEYWLEDRAVLTFSDSSLERIQDQFNRGKDTKHIEVVVGTHRSHIVLRSVPIKRLRWYVKEKYGIDIP
jgi:hypothetical protein